jgi:ubiquinone/menaquinone biosynthesis C-methylase UbiE
MEQYVIRGGQLGYERLQVLARVWMPSTAALFDRFGLSTGMRCLDLGCGGGNVTLEMARRVGPAGQVVGVDIDEVKLGLARQVAAEQNLANVEFRRMNVYEWSEPDSYDVVHCRHVLQHLSRPLDVLQAMWAAVRAGGVIVVQDADFDGCFCDPPNEAFEFWVEAYQRVLRLHGGDPVVGRRLHRYFSRAGIPEPELTVVQGADTSGEAKSLPYSTVEATAEAIVKNKVASADQVSAALAQLAEFAMDPGSLVGSPRVFQAWARRPAR